VPDLSSFSGLRWKSIKEDGNDLGEASSDWPPWMSTRKVFQYFGIARSTFEVFPHSSNPITQVGIVGLDQPSWQLIDKKVRIAENRGT
jgi:hypothetical protein